MVAARIVPDGVQRRPEPARCRGFGTDLPRLRYRGDAVLYRANLGLKDRPDYTMHQTHTGLEYAR